MLGFALGYAAGKGGRGSSDGAEALAGIFIAIILILIVSLIGGAIYGVSQLVTSEEITYETVITDVTVNRQGTYANYYVEFKDSLGETQKVNVSYKEYKEYRELIGEPIVVTSDKHGVWVDKESNHEFVLKSKLKPIESTEKN